MNKPTETQIQEVLAGTATAQEARAVAKWFATEEGMAYLSERLPADADQIKPGYEDLWVNGKIPSEEMIARILTRIRRKRIRRILFRAAAVVIPVLLLAGIYVQLDERVDLFGTSGYEEIYVPKGERLQMMFQDGTRAYLNSNSRLTYPKQFALFNREVRLEGEAYFVVSKNPRRPFVVHLNGAAVHVLGTSFDVHAYPENSDITVCLDEGSVSLKSPSEREYRLSPGEKLVYHKADETGVVTQRADTRLASLWKQNIIAFKDAPLSEVIEVLNRWYDVRFKVEAPATDVSFTLTSTHTILEKVLGDLEKISPLRFEYHEGDSTVVVRRKQ